MITIPEVVEKIIVSFPFLEELMSDNLINYSALARKIRPEIEKKLLKRVELGAILMALRRMKLMNLKTNSLTKIIRSHNDLIVRSNLIEFVIANINFSIDMHQKLIELSEKEEEYFLTITEGVFETTIITSSQLANEVKKILSKKDIINQLNNLSSITIRLPKENVYTRGLYYYFLKALAWEGINLIEVVSTYTEFTIILDDKEVDHAFSVLKKVFSTESI